MANKEVLDLIGAERVRRTTELTLAQSAADTLETLSASWAREAELLNLSQKKGWQSEARNLGSAVVLLKLEITALEKRATTKPPVREPVTGPSPSWTDPAALGQLVTDAETAGLGKIVAGDAPCLGTGPHLAHTWIGRRDQVTGSDRWRCPGDGPLAGLGTVKCSGCGDPVTVDQQDCPTCLNEEFAARQPLVGVALGVDDSVAAYLSGATNELAYADAGRAIIEQAAAQLDVPLTPVTEHRCPDCGEVVDHDTSNAACPNCTTPSPGMSITRHTGNGTPYTVSGQTAVIERLGTHLATESTVHQEVDASMPDVHAEPLAPMFTDSSAPTSRTRPVPPSMVDETPYTWADLGAPARPSTIPDHMSPSQLSTLDTCPAQARLSRYEGMPGIPLWGAVGGTAFHRAVEVLEREQLDGTTDWMNALVTIVEPLWSTVFHAVISEEIAKSGVPMSDWYASASGKENYSWWLVEGGEMVKRYVTYRVRHDDGRKVLVLPDGRPAIELELTLNLGALPVKVILDIVWQLSDGSLEIWDHKTRRDYMGPIVDTIQLGTQGWALHKAMGGSFGFIALPDRERPGAYLDAQRIAARYFDARKGVLTNAFDPLDRHPIEELEMRYADADDKRRNRPAIPVRSNLCKACPVAYLCPVGSKL